MRKLCEEKGVLFAVLWIVAYCLVIGTIKGSYGYDSPLMLAALFAFAAGICVFVKRNHLEKKYGLAGWPKDTKRFLYFIPLWILSTGNLWGGVQLKFHGAGLVCAVLSMALVGFVEEMIFRGFLFKGMLAEGKPAPAVIVSSLTFGIGHIVNFLTGQAGFETAVQIVFAVIVRQRRPFRRPDGTMVFFEDNAAVIVTDTGETKGTDIKGPVAREAADRWPRIAATASTIV